MTRLPSLVDSPSHRLLDEAQDDLVVQGHLRSQKRRLRREKLTPVGGRGAYLLDRATDRSVTGGSESRRSAQLVLLCSAAGSDVDRATLVTCRRTALSPTDGAGHDGGREHLLDGLVTALVMAKAGTVTRG